MTAGFLPLQALAERRYRELRFHSAKTYERDGRILFPSGSGWLLFRI